jgi:hypothetical protein
VLEVEDLEDRAIDVDVVAALELVCADDGRSALSRAIFQMWFGCRSTR